MKELAAQETHEEVIGSGYMLLPEIGYHPIRPFA